MNARGEGGRYVVAADGTRTLVERTNWTPATDSPVAETPSTLTEEIDDVLEEEISTGED